MIASGEFSCGTGLGWGRGITPTWVPGYQPACGDGEDTGTPSCSPAGEATEGLGAPDRVSPEV